jgi:hypothetical protein
MNGDERRRKIFGQFSSNWKIIHPKFSWTDNLAYQNKEYLSLHQSTLRKVDILDGIVDRANKNQLKVAVSVRVIYGLTPSGIGEIIRNNWILNTIKYVIVFAFGAAAEPIIQWLFGTKNF